MSRHFFDAIDKASSSATGEQDRRQASAQARQAAQLMSNAAYSECSSSSETVDIYGDVRYLMHAVMASNWSQAWLYSELGRQDLCLAAASAPTLP